jgi:SAM-dependent methyltransferase
VSRWGDPQTVAGFSRSEPNAALLRFVEREMQRGSQPNVLDQGCGAGRNAVPMAALGCRVLGTDIEWPMLEAASRRARAQGVASRTQWALAPMDRLPAASRAFDVIVAHGIWNLATRRRPSRRAVGRRWEDVPEKERQRHQADAARAGWAGRTSRQRSAEMSRRRQEGLRRRDVKQKVIGMLQAQPDTDYPIVVTTKCIRCGRRLVLHATSEQALPIGWQDLAECPSCWSK